MRRHKSSIAAALFGVCAVLLLLLPFSPSPILPLSKADWKEATWTAVTGEPATVAEGGTGKSAWTKYVIPYLSDTTTFGEIAIGTAGQALIVNPGANGYTWGSFAPTGKGVTNGDSHDHVGGDGAQIPLGTGVTGTLPVANGGTGAGSFTANTLLKGNTTSAIAESGITDDGTTAAIARAVTVGTNTAGKNLTVYATLGAEMAPALEAANWTLGFDTGGWTAGTGVLAKTASTGTQTATPSGTFSVVAGTTYKVVMVVSAAANSPSYTLGGVTGTTLTATTITDYITASTTGKIIFSGGATATCTITSLSVKALTDATGDVTVEGNLVVKSQLLLAGSGAAYPAIAFDMARTSGIYYANNAIRMAVGGTYSFYLNASGLTLPSGNFAIGPNADVILERDAADTLAQRRTTNQQIFRLYNTYTGASDYERLTLTGVQGASVNLTAETAGTGGDNLDIVLTPAGTGKVTTTAIYASGDVSADTFTDHTPHYDGDALSAIAGIAGKDGQIDHATLPEFVRRTISRTVVDSVTDETVEVAEAEAFEDRAEQENLTEEKVIETVDQKGERTTRTEQVPIVDRMKVKWEAVNGAVVRQEVPVYKTRTVVRRHLKDGLTVDAESGKISRTTKKVAKHTETEEGRDVGAMVSVLVRAVQQLTAEVADLKAKAGAGAGK